MLPQDKPLHECRVPACLFDCMTRSDPASQPGQNRRKVNKVFSSPDSDGDRRIKAADFRQAFMLKIVDDNCLRLDVHDPVFPDACLCIFGMLNDQIPAPGTRGQDLDDQIRRSLATL